MASQPVLDLDTLADRPTVRINGKDYRLWSVDLLPPLDNHKVRKLLKRNEVLARQDDLTKAEEKELEKILDEICRIVLDAPEAVQKKLTAKQRAEIIQAFHLPSLQLLIKMLAAADAAVPDNPDASRTGERSPDESAGSTQA